MNCTVPIVRLVYTIFFSTATCIAAAQEGISAGTISLGQSAGFTSPEAPPRTTYAEGANLYFDYVNKNGGINGRQIKLISLDDAGVPDKAVANTKKLIEEDRVFALMGYTGTSTTKAALPLVNNAKVPIVGLYSGAEDLRKPQSRYVFHTRTSYATEAEEVVKQLSAMYMKSVAVFYQSDDFGKNGLAAIERAAAKEGLTILARGTVEPRTTNVSEAVKTIAQANPQAVILVTPFRSSAEFIRQMRRAKANPQFVNVSLAGFVSLAKELGEDGRGVAVSHVVPLPFQQTAAVVREYTKLAEGAGKQIAFIGLEGFIQAKVVVEGLRRAGPNPTREKFIAALESLNYDVGGLTVRFGPGEHNGSNFTSLSVLGANGAILN